MVYRKTFQSKGNPKFESVNLIMAAMGYYLMPQKLDRQVG